MWMLSTARLPQGELARKSSNGCEFPAATGVLWLVMALRRGSCYPFLQDPQLQIATPPPPIDKVAATGHLHRSSRQLPILISQLAICQCVYRRTHRLPHGEFITSTHHNPPHSQGSAYIILYVKCGVNGISVLFTIPSLFPGLQRNQQDVGYEPLHILGVGRRNELVLAKRANWF